MSIRLQLKYCFLTGRIPAILKALFHHTLLTNLPHTEPKGLIWATTHWEPSLGLIQRNLLCFVEPEPKPQNNRWRLYSSSATWSQVISRSISFFGSSASQISSQTGNHSAISQTREFHPGLAGDAFCLCATGIDGVLSVPAYLFFFSRTIVPRTTTGTQGNPEVPLEHNIRT